MLQLQMTLSPIALDSPFAELILLSWTQDSMNLEKLIELFTVEYLKLSIHPWFPHQAYELYTFVSSDELTDWGQK